MSAPTSLRRSWFAVWRWKWWMWVAVSPLLVGVYVTSAPLAYAIANQCLRTNSPVLWWLSDVVRWFYYPVEACGKWYQPLADFIDWEYGLIMQLLVPGYF